MRITVRWTDGPLSYEVEGPDAKKVQAQIRLLRRVSADASIPPSAVEVRGPYRAVIVSAGTVGPGLPPGTNGLRIARLEPEGLAVLTYDGFAVPPTDGSVQLVANVTAVARGGGPLMAGPTGFCPTGIEIRVRNPDGQLTPIDLLRFTTFTVEVIELVRIGP